MTETDHLLEATTALVPPILTGLDVMSRAGRHMHPPHLPQLIEEIEPFRTPIEQGLQAFATVSWPAHLSDFAACMRDSGETLLRSFDEFLSAVEHAQPAMAAYRAMGLATKATAAIYPLAQVLPPVSRFFLHAQQADDDAFVQRVLNAEAGVEDTGVMHADNNLNQRGGVSMYVPEYYNNEPVPLIMALHGGSGHGRQFLWSWLRTARSRNAILISPTSAENTWSLMGPDVDTPRLDGLVAYAREQWNIDADRILLTGMSDGGTFSYVTGLRGESPFTHLAPCSASFHPMLAEMADAQRLQDLPIYLIHGALDWMFPVDVARGARDALTAAGARVAYREIDDLSHTYPYDENERIFDWLTA